ncbi:MAG: adenosylmethionine--8-amino-7-oxononanoate transaminase [Endomicrobia bacterium]|nr:adenosylmethionine--8-amino-7-oxononanoate transaminase [Endomicrobiia bacterium]MCL2506564.1 adenosylmethionine--8-amino-7-oxononanoate transaminase [Endomicrobiia bacterium]MCL2506599.1 adenosylmethionine--8-amino-7-oxononanoate transaminase [Endomicrobiia bacterium]
MNIKQQLIKKDKQNVWHPYTQMADWINNDPYEPLIIEKAKDSYLYDIDGKKYLDGVSSLWVTLLGHRNPKIDKAVKKQIDRVSHTTFLGLTHKPAIELSEKLLNILPKNLTKVFYSDNGSTAVEVALKMAYQYWQFKGEQRNCFLSLKNAYHGDTIGTMAVGGTDLFHSKFKPLFFKNYFAQSPYCYRCPYRKNEVPFPNNVKNFKEHKKIMGCSGQCIKEVEIILSKNHKEIAAAIIEPINQAAAGMIIMPKGYVKEYAILCKRYNVPLICDEVAVGFGRTGKMFAIEHDGVKPDFICLSKGITGGYLPLAVTVTTNKIYDAFLGKYEEFKTFFHGHSYTANPLACAAANATLDILKKDNVLKKLQPKIVHLEKELLSLYKHDKVGNIRHSGVMAGIEVVKDKKKGKAFDYKLKTGARVCANLRKEGIIIRPLGDTLVLFLHLTMTNKEISKIISAIRKQLDKL